MTEPTPSACLTPGCKVPTPPVSIPLPRGVVWARGDYCPACTARRAAPPPPVDPLDPGPKPPPAPCVNVATCGGTVGHLLIESASRRFWTRDGSECVSCLRAGREELGRERYEARLERSWLPKRYADFRFDRVLVQQKTETPEAFATRIAACASPHLGITPYNTDIARELRGWRRGGRSLYLTGPVGGGKTTLVAALLTRLMWEDVGVLYLPEAQLYDTVRKGMAAERGTRVFDVVGVASRCSVLALDDLGTMENLAPWQRNVVEQVVCARYDADLPIIVTSNLRISDVANLHGERVASRLAEMCGRRQLELLGYDWRTGQQHIAPTAPAPKVPDGPKAVQASLPLVPSWSKPPVRDYKAAAAGERDDD